MTKIIHPKLAVKGGLTMDMKEKLVEILRKPIFPHELVDPIEAVADYLLDSGVTVQEKKRFLLKENGDLIPLGQEWISVKDRLPIEEAKAHEQEWCEEYCEFLVMIDRGFLPTTLYYDWEENEWFRINTALKREKYKVTHWMPLPKPPKGD
jgi:hypothetical protein